MQYEQSDKKKFATVQQWIPFFVKLTNARKKDFGKFCALELEVFRLTVRHSLAGNSAFSLLRGNDLRASVVEI